MYNENKNYRIKITINEYFLLLYLTIKIHHQLQKIDKRGKVLKIYSERSTRIYRNDKRVCILIFPILYKYIKLAVTASIHEKL